MQQFGDLLMAALSVLEKPRQGVQTAIGALPGIDGLPTSGDQAYERGRARSAGIAQAVAGTGALGPAVQLASILPTPIQGTTNEILGDTLTDPLNVVGFGLPGKGATAIRASSRAGQMAPEALASTLELMQYLESGFGKAVQNTLRGPFVGNQIHAPEALRGRVPDSWIQGFHAPGIADALGSQRTARAVQGAKVWDQEMIPQTLPGVDDFFIQGQQARAPKSILDFITSMHAQSIVKHRDTDLADAVRYVQANGGNLEDALAEMNLAKDLFPAAAKKKIQRGGQTVETLDYDANLKRLHQVEDGVWDTMNRMSDPRAKLSGIELLGQAQERVMNMWYDSLIELQKAGDLVRVVRRSNTGTIFMRRAMSAVRKYSRLHSGPCDGLRAKYPSCLTWTRRLPSNMTPSGNITRA
jgi:hypothetical protein